MTCLRFVRPAVAAGERDDEMDGWTTGQMDEEGCCRAC